MMMKLLSLASLVGVTSAFSSGQIGVFVDQFQGSRPAILDSVAVAFADPNSYQSQAKAKTMEVLDGIDSTQAFEIRQFYTLACLYYSTNGVPNARTNTIIPGEVIPNWATDDWFIDPNYCTWFGVACFDSLADTATQTAQEAEKLVVEINLSENDLYGLFPNEISLLSASLIAIDLFENFFHSCVDYRWMTAMTNMVALFFGTTSWDRNGIPFELRFMDQLQELDCSNTFWRGELTETAFNNLKQLRYLDIGENFFLLNTNELPDYITGLPLLSNLYADNIRASPGSTGSGTLSLGFLTRITNLVECWMDFTNVLDSIPDNIGDLKLLQSLSLVYCKLTGTIPNSIVNTVINRLWLYGNPNLTGAFPPGFENLDWSFLYLEGTGLTAQIPKEICEQVGTVEGEDLTELGADCDICPTGCCTCCGDVCNNLRTPTPAPTADGAPTGPLFCFPGDSLVEVEGSGYVKMSNLNLGDHVKVSADKFEPIYSFGHKSSDTTGEFVAIHAEGGRKLELSDDHMVAIEGGRIIPASMVQIGDKILTSSGVAAAVTTIRTVKRSGLYAPFTQSGTVVVNDVLASNYVAFQGSEYLKIAGVDTVLNYHWMAHIFKSVHRIAYKMGLASTETYTSDGTSTWVAAPRDMGLWLLEQNPIIMVLGLVPYVALFSVTSMMESMSMMTMATLLVGALTLVVARRNVSFKMSKQM